MRNTTQYGIFLTICILSSWFRDTTPTKPIRTYIHVLTPFAILYSYINVVHFFLVHYDRDPPSAHPINGNGRIRNCRSFSGYIRANLDKDDKPVVIPNQKGRAVSICRRLDSIVMSIFFIRYLLSGRRIKLAYFLPHGNAHVRCTVPMATYLLSYRYYIIIQMAAHLPRLANEIREIRRTDETHALTISCHEHGGTLFSVPLYIKSRPITTK